MGDSQAEFEVKNRQDLAEVKKTVLNLITAMGEKEAEGKEAKKFALLMQLKKVV